MAILYFMLILSLAEVVTSNICSVCEANCTCSTTADYCTMTCPSVQDFNTTVLMENPNIKALNLQNNRITILDIDVFIGLSGLEELDLSNNQIITLEAGVFNGLSGLKDLRLSNNSIITLQQGVFRELFALENLYLNDNEFTTLEPDVYSGLPSLLFIYIDGNPLNCSCMEGFITWISNSSANTSYTCQPSGTTILDFNNFGGCSGYSCSIENFTTCFLHDSDAPGYLRWIPHSGDTFTSGTGPDSAFSGNSYLYAEASSLSGKVYRLESNILSSYEGSCLRFAYHMYGSTMGKLDLIINYPGTSRSAYVSSVHGNQGQNWHLANISVPSGPIQISFQATIGNNTESDIAIDDVYFESGSCQMDQCTSLPCQNNGSCIGLINTFTCDCLPGFTDTNCSTEIDECERNPCGNNGSCIDKLNGYTCTCSPGYTDTNCFSEINECASDPCQNNGSCTDKINGYTCACSPGYTDTNCSTDINECETIPCQNNGSCTDVINGYTCACVPGYTDTNCSTDINECASNPCGSTINCTDGINSYNCHCPDGTIRTTCSAASASTAPISQAGIALIATGSVIFVAVAGIVVVVIVVKVCQRKPEVAAAN